MDDADATPAPTEDEIAALVKDQEQAAAFCAVIAKVVHLIARDCGEIPIATVVQALMLTSCHFARHNGMSPAQLRDYIDENFEESTGAVTEALHAIFGSPSV